MSKTRTGIGKSEYTTPEGVVTEWVGPYRLADAPDQCNDESLKAGVYLAFGRHKFAAWWPFWWEARWVRSFGSAKKYKLSTRLTRYPLQYIGIGGDVCDRAKTSAHAHLKHLSPHQTYVWFARSINHLDKTSVTKVGWPTSIYAMEKVLIFCLKPRRNIEGIDQATAPIFASWCRSPNLDGSNHIAKRQARRLPVSIRFEKESVTTVEFNAPVPVRYVRFTAPEAVRVPVRALAVWLFGAP